MYVVKYFPIPLGNPKDPESQLLPLFLRLILLVFSPVAAISQSCFSPPSCDHEDVKGKPFAMECPVKSQIAKCIFTKRSHYVFENTGSHKKTNPFSKSATGTRQAGAYGAREMLHGKHLGHIDTVLCGFLLLNLSLRRGGV